MQINSADLRSLKRADAIGLLLGAVLTLTGMLTVVLVGVLRRRASSLIWLGLFSLIYGLRLLERTEIFRMSFDVPAAVWERADAVI